MTYGDKKDDYRLLFEETVDSDYDRWFVWTKHGSRPKFAHVDEAAALAEAQRLANRYPGNSFIVMHAVHKARVDLRAELPVLRAPHRNASSPT